MLAESGQTPAVVWVDQGQSATTASFTPPAGSWCIAATGMTGGTAFQTTPSTKCVDSKGNTWAAATIQQESSGIAVVQFFSHYFATSPGSITVTFSQTANQTNQAIMLAVRVMTGAKTSQSGAGTTNSRHVPVSYAWHWQSGPTAPNSWIFQIVSYLLSSNTATEYDANTTTISNLIDGGSSDDCNVVFGKQTNPTANLTPLELGWYGTSGVTGFAGINLEVLAQPVPCTVNLVRAEVNVAANSPVPIGGTIVNLLTASVNVDAPDPTPQSYRITSGGPGDAGKINVTYISPNVQALTYSISPLATTDPYGNEVPAGYQGPITAIEPGTQPSVTERWHSLALSNCTGSGYGVDGFYYIYRSDTEVELLWDIQLSSATASPTLATLPAGYRPQVEQNVMSSWYGNADVAYQRTYSPHLVVQTDGVIKSKDALSLTSIILFGRSKISLETL